MPQWTDSPGPMLENALDQIWIKLDRSIAEDPSFDLIAGVPKEMLMEHSASALQSYFEHFDENSFDASDPNMWLQIYSLGFIVGKRFGEAMAGKDVSDI